MPRFGYKFGVRWPLAALVALVIAGCGDSGGGGAAPAPSPGPPAPPPPPAPPGATVTISGKVTYDFVPVATIGGLNYAGTDSNRPVRLATVQYVDSGNNVVVTTRTDQNGDYSLDVDQNQTGRVRVRAESLESGSWAIQVVDNTASNAIFTLDGALLSSGTVDSQRDLHAASGWTGASYGNPRAAAPFAILDTILIGTDVVLSADPSLTLPTLIVHWSENNVSSYDANGNVDTDSGEIGTSQFRFTDGLYLLGEENTDTEEYDRHVILHEFGHYLEFNMARSDSIGGAHSLGDELDMRVAYSEGLATALAALMLDNSIYKDTGGPAQAGAFTFDVEGVGTSTRGFYSEISVHELIYDLVDLNNTNDRNDVFSYPFSTVWDAMTDPLVNTFAVTSIFPFLNAVKNANPGDQVALDLFASGQDIGSISTDYGDNETNNAGSADVLPIYTELTVNNLTPVNVCSTNEFASGTDSSNKLSAARFIRFTPPAGGNVTISVVATEIPPGEFADPDFILHRRGPRNISSGQPSDACMNTNGLFWDESNCGETAIMSVTNAPHVLEVFEWTNAWTNDDTENFPPIGRTCFDVTVTQP